MNFHPTDEQLALVEPVDRWLRHACDARRLRKAFEGDDAMTAAIWSGLCDLGLAGVMVPQDQGGLGLSMFDVVLIAERLGWWAAPGPWPWHVLASMAIAEYGSEAQRSEWLPRLATGEVVATCAFAEGDRWNPESWTLAAGNAASGTKDYVPGPGVAGLCLAGLAGGRLGLVDLNASGVELSPWVSTDFTRPVGQLRLSKARVDPLPSAGGADVFDAGLILLAADAHGGSQRMLEDIVEYSKMRVQFGRPIGSFQAVKHTLANMALFVEPNAPLAWHAARAFDDKSDELRSAAAAAKAHITDTFADVARTATESYGGIGYTWEHAAHLWLRRSLFDYAYFGSPADHRRRLAHLLEL